MNEPTQPAPPKPPAKTKPVVSTAAAAPIDNDKPPVRHIVLKEKRGADWHPLLSCEHGDKGADDLIAAEKVERINAAKRSGGPVPEFRVVQEIKGKEAKPI